MVDPTPYRFVPFAKIFISRLVNVTRLTLGERESESSFDIDSTSYRAYLRRTPFPFDELVAQLDEGHSIYFPSLIELELLHLIFDQARNDLSNLLRFCLSRDNKLGRGSGHLKITTYGCVIELAKGSRIPFPNMYQVPTSRVLAATESGHHKMKKTELG